VTHRPAEAPADAGSEFVNGLDEAIARAREAAGEKDVFVMGGADVIRQALRGDYVEELTITIAPVVLGAGKRLFEDFDESLNLEHVRLLQSPFATHITYRVPALSWRSRGSRVRRRKAGPGAQAPSRGFHLLFSDPVTGSFPRLRERGGR
jgi:hypothetical protein